MKEIIASTTILGVWKNGQELLLELTVGKPYYHEDAWICWICITGLDKRPQKSYGIDSLQALLLALTLAESQLSTFVAMGGQLLHPDGREPLSLKLIFPKAKPQ